MEPRFITFSSQSANAFIAKGYLVFSPSMIDCLVVKYVIRCSHIYQQNEEGGEEKCNKNSGRKFQRNNFSIICIRLTTHTLQKNRCWYLFKFCIFDQRIQIPCGQFTFIKAYQNFHNYNQRVHRIWITSGMHHFFQKNSTSPRLKRLDCIQVK